jgi:peptide-methionine (R)-S-oxide reductase
MIEQKIGRRGALGLGGAAVAFVMSAGAVASGPAQGGFEVRLSPAEWRRRLGAARYAVLREGATERAGTSPLDRQKARGTYGCAGCGLPLFHSSTKFDSGTGWPSFFRALPNSVITRTDRSFGVRTEVLCRRCGGHLGHVFDDGPKPTGLRYCMNGLALRFRPA